MKPRLPIKRSNLFLILFFLLLSTSHGVSTIHAQTVSDSKLGVFILGQSDTAPTIIDSGPRVIKVMDPQSNSTILEYVREYKKKYPDSIVVLRVYEGIVGKGYSLGDNPEEAAQEFWNGVLSPALAKLGSDKELFDYVSGPNEFDKTPVVNSEESVKWTNRFWLQLAELIAGAGLRPLLGEIPVGNLGKEHLDGLVPSLRFIKSKGGAWSYHAYTLHYTTDINDEYYYSLRYRQFYEYFSEKYPDLTDLPMILTEAGVDESGGPATSGWQARGDASKYQNWLMWFDSEIKKDQYILGSTIFQLGDSHWSSFNIEPISSWLASYVSGSPLPIEEGGTSTTSECDRSPIWGGLVDFFRGLGRKLAQKKVGSELKKVTEGGLPPVAIQDASVQDPACKDDEEVNTIPQVASRYTLASGMGTPHDDKEPVSTNLLANLIAFLGEIMGIVDKGDKEAGEFVKEDLPGEVGDKIWTQYVRTNDLAQSENDSQVLGVSKEKGEMMTEALSMKQCFVLPPGVGDCANSGTLLGSAEASPGPSVSPAPTIEPGTGPSLYYDTPFHKDGYDKDGQQYSSEEINNIANNLEVRMPKIVAAVSKKWPTSMIGHWREIFDKSIAQGWNPAFVLAIWIEETAASDVCSLKERQGKDGIWDFGVVSLPKTYCEDSQGTQLSKLNDQLDAFLNIINKIESPKTFEKFMCRYSEGHYPCTFDRNPGFLQRLPLVYDCLVHPSPSASVCPAGYFSF